jgi:hypothetical protein
LNASWDVLADAWLAGAPAGSTVEEHLRSDKAGVAYAACWVFSEVKQPAMLDVSTLSGIKVWVNPRANSRPAVDAPDRMLSHVFSHSEVPVELQPGWNEIFVKTDSQTGRWAFYLELRDSEGSRPLEGIKVQAQPPREEKKP